MATGALATETTTTHGELALVLHAHLPYVHSSEPGSLEEDWYFQALLECYLPLLDVLEAAAADPSQRPRLSMGLSPTLLSLFSSPDLSERFGPWLAVRQELLLQAPVGFEAAAADLAQQLSDAAAAWQRCNGNLLPRFQRLQQAGVLDLLTCAATHGYLPLLRDCPEAVRAQLLTAVREHQRLLGVRPQGIWLPECAYYEGLDRLLVSCGLRYAILDAHGLLHGQPRPRYGVYAPICTPAGMAFFGRDSESTLPVWSARDGYPGDASYREFHRDLGWDLPDGELEQRGINCRRPLGLKLHRVSSRDCGLDGKQPYEPAAAHASVRRDAAHYLQGRSQHLQHLQGAMERAPLLVAPFDAELFGHWWFEGPRFLAEMFRQAPASGVGLTTLRDTLSRGASLQLCQPSPSSWGQGGYHNYWLNDSNAWVIPEWNRASRAMVARVSRGVGSEQARELLNQAGRELLLAQSSDWSFILRAGTTTELARERIERHLGRFWQLLGAIDGEVELPEGWLEAVRAEDALFPLINAADWAQIPAAAPLTSTTALAPRQQLDLLARALPAEQQFEASLEQRQLSTPRRSALRVLQLNLGKLCNMRCSHCHVDAGPHQGHTLMSDAVVDKCIAAMARLQPAVVDLTGGAPELHPRFKELVLAARAQGCHVIDRCNLTVLLLPALRDLAAFLAEHEVEIVASLPQPEAESTDAQRGDGTWEASIEALKRLNQLGYGQGDPKRQLTLMSNPAGTRLQQLTPCDTAQWKRRLQELAGVQFDQLIGLNNMPIARFLEQLQGDGHVNCYLKLLHNAFNPEALNGLMCRDTLSVAADGQLFDCDFNQMLELPLGGSSTTIEAITREQLEQRAIRWGNHCFGCTAGQGSSCAGATA